MLHSYVEGGNNYRLSGELKLIHFDMFVV